ncbi:MAG: hypothetical protein H6607_01770 [Flavobacteriales bacterium]|nr:hypothetical protein [Flavobacteriales bacterium]
MELPRVKIGRRHHKQFNYIPVFYDEDKEDLHNRIEKAKSERDGTVEGFENRIRMAYKHRDVVPIDNHARKMKLVSQLRVLMFVIVFSMIAYLVFYTNTINIIFEAF